MSKTIDIFVDYPGQIEHLVKELELLLSHSLTHKYDNYESWYEFQNQTIVVTLSNHDFEDDRDLRFSDYPYQISIRAINIPAEMERQKVCEDFTKMIWQQLKTQKYHLILVEDLQIKLDSFVPLVTT
ncbi:MULTISPECIES: hypothetical protein [Kamptonema]|uniref:hypothetical protein n=1 Tax=Kamptonema TaxID=1501433 RepID=UPI0001DACD07|nr:MULTISPECIES: hypothetical protein [Kamptonema]CBN59248.1 hypothetical protein OSCI_4100008 [Kamptonema sp. PCC 6506]